MLSKNEEQDCVNPRKFLNASRGIELFRLVGRNLNAAEHNAGHI